MEEVRQLVQEEGREARNLVAFHVAVDTPAALGRAARRPPRASCGPRRGAGRAGARRSASAGRDKRSELRARYWALLFGDLQRAIGEIYNTVEAHENQNECQEVILVLENYTRDFKALGEWFRLKWEYDNTPPPQRPQSLAWEIRKTDFVRPESRRAYSVKSSPSVSGKNSPCLSGHNTPSGKNSPVTGKASPGSGKISPRVPAYSSTSPKANIEFFSNKIASKITTKPEPKVAKETRLSDIKEKDIKENCEDNDIDKVIVNENDAETKPAVELGKAKESPNVSPKPVVIKSPKHDKTQAKPDSTQEISIHAKVIIARLDVMETEFLNKQLLENAVKNDNLLNQDKESEEIIENDSKMESNKTDVTLKPSEENDGSVSDSPVKSEDNFADVSNDSSPGSNNEEKELTIANDKTESLEKTLKTPSPESGEIDDIKEKAIPEKNIKEPEAVNDTKESVLTKKTSEQTEDKEEQDPKKVEPKIAKPAEVKPLEVKAATRPAYSQAAAKPKVVTAKPEVKPPIRTNTPIVRSKTVMEIPNTVPKTRQPFPRRNQTSKCSYPFNLTTGRTSLFDTTPSVKVGTKKPITRPGSGDAKLGQNKIDPKKRPPRPLTLKVNEKGDKKDKPNLTLEKIKDCDEYSSTDTIVTQIDMSRIESSESLKTLVPEEGYMSHDGANSVEVLNVDNIRSDNEEWLTVKSRRLSRESKKQSKSHWANRFHQPSATTSLPTLNMMESPKQEANPIIKPDEPKFDRAKSEQPEKVTKPVKVKMTKPKEKAKDPAIIRQKSDVTGLKTRSAKNKVTKKSERGKGASKLDGELTKSRLHSSLESLTTGLSRSQESTEDVFDFDKWKEEFKSRFNCFDDDDQISNHNEILKSADPSEMSEIAEMTSQIEENERKMSLALDFQSDADQRKLCAEEDLLNRQILELQQVSDIDMDTETDDTETDAEILCEETNISVPSCPSPENLGPLAASLEDQYETALAGMSWAERVDTLVVLEALVARDPGRAQQLHAKLSQGIKRRGSLQDALRRLQAKQARAEKQRQEYQTERARKIHQLLARVEEVKVAKNQLIEEKRLRLDRRLQKAAENRDQHLKDIVRKAHDEEEKLREIAFIKQLEAENRRHDFLDQCRSHTTRLRQMRRDRLEKLEQKAAREAAVGARRRALEAARGLRVQALLERRRLRDARRDQLWEQRRQQRGDAAREKAEGVKSRLSALAAAAELEADALRERIRDKQDASQMRLESHLQAIREKATGPRQATTSESQDQSTKEERELQEEAERAEQERKEREKQKAIKKRARKVKQKLLTTCDIAFSDDNLPLEAVFPPSHKMFKVIQQLTNILSPLLDTEPGRKHDDEDDVDKNNKKNKNKNNNKIVNGNGDVANGHSANKKTKKQKSEEKETIEAVNVNTENNVENNNNMKTEVIIESKDIDTANGDVKNEGVHNKKKMKKNKNKDDHNKNSDKPKLSKTSSVCSSLSDMSKTSCKSDKKCRVIIDTAYLDRQLNELHRMMEKFDKGARDKSLAQKMHGLKALGQLLAVAAERDDLAPQLSAKTLTTAVMIISRVIANCSMSAAYFVTTNSCVHAVKLLADRLDKDLQSEPKELEVCKQVSDCLSIALDSVLCATRMRESGAAPDALDGQLLSALRGRAHALLSYLCLLGCVAKAENAGEARESVHTLLTVSADLCHPCEADEGPERASATQSLRCALGTSICGARAEFCMLFAKDTDIEEQCGDFVRAARTAHLLKAVAEMDYHIVQEAFGEGGWPLEFRAAVSRLLSQHAPNDRESPRKNMLRLSNRRLDQTLSETMVLDLIVLVGFVVVNNAQLQETICSGWGAIKTLCTLPAAWLVCAPHRHALLPALIALADHPPAAAALAADLSTAMLDEYLESPEAQKVKLVQVIKQGRAKRCTGKK
ncbi:S phase cyclin A-associated protein in the endoplasmic reticulum isoform X2 [Pectinophora gossypiella]|uniref:S phase cyclin A-associated protein in the endoplasmic reticulum isoform X2 n=1 Tax=Pectinophora gossypiella TaxID=13191 RepID=UPI00214EC03C|nr:S phase cyclin A-associated protein in the endoplasmic reticulum isoform X2 [Pectinophora gossypiella]